MSERFSQIVLGFLKQAGWHAGRCISTERFAESNRESGFFWGERAKQFLEEFGNLKLVYPSPQTPKIADSCHFDADSAAGMAIPEAVHDYECLLGSRLTVVGEAFNDNMTLCMDEAGAMYGGVENTLVRFGDNLATAISTLCVGGKSEIIDMREAISTRIGEDSSSLTSAAKTALLESGWYGDLLNVESQSPTAFLTAFNGATFRYPRRDGNFDVCRISAIDIDASYLSSVSMNLGRSVIPVGEVVNASGVLLMDENGNTYLGVRETADILWQLGKNGTAAINNLVAGIEAPRVV